MLLNLTENIRLRLEALSVSQFVNAGPLHFLFNFIDVNNRDSLVPSEEGNRIGAFIDHVRACLCRLLPYIDI